MPGVAAAALHVSSLHGGAAVNAAAAAAALGLSPRDPNVAAIVAALQFDE